MAAEFDTAHVKNIVLLGHAGAGKTTLAESMLFEAGLISKRGTIEEKNTVSDHHELEKERGNSIFSTLLHTRWRGYKINIIDTPGYADFAGEVISSLRVADTAVMILNASMGVEVGNDILWDYTRAFGTPLILAVNQLDHEQADFEHTLSGIREQFGSKVMPLQYPMQEGEGFHAIIDVLSMLQYKFRDAGGKPEKLPIPAQEAERAAALHKELVEAVAGNDEELMERYFEVGELTEAELKEGMRKAMKQQELIPVFCLSAMRNMGSGRLMGFIDQVCPGANELPAQSLTNGEALACDPQGPAALFIYKTVSEPHVGELSFFKVCSGSVRSGAELVNETTGSTEKLNQLFVMEGNKRIAVPELVAGDIGATLKLRNTHTNNTLHEKGTAIELSPIHFPDPHLSVAIEPVRKGEEEKLANALHQLREEDPTLVVEVSAELKQTILHCQGELHLAVIKWKLSQAHHVDVSFHAARIPYRETVRSTAEAVYRHKKQSGGSGQFAEVHLRVEPYYEGMPDPNDLTVRGREIIELAWGGKLAFYNCIVGGAIDLRFLPSILKGVMEKMHEGPLTGSYARDIRVCVFDGKMHAVDSNDLSFKIAGLMAFKQAFKAAQPLLLEPLGLVEILSPEEFTGSVMGDLQSRRAMVEGIDGEGHFARITVRVPLAEMRDYSSVLRSITQGRAKFKIDKGEYAPVPAELQKKLTEDYSKTAREELVP